MKKGSKYPPRFRTFFLPKKQILDFNIFSDSLLYFASAIKNLTIMNSMKKTIITVVGNDTVGIIAKVCTYLAQNQVNILDISQTIVQGYFNMMMVADTSASDKEIATLSKELAALGDEIGVVIHCQHEDIFNVMHRI